MVVGRQVYAAPEKLDGDWARCDGRCDVFALAVLLSELLVGRPQRDKSDIEWFKYQQQHKQEEEEEAGEEHRLRTWGELLDSDVVDWKSFFDCALVADVSGRLSVEQAIVALRRRPSARKKRDRARAREKRQQVHVALQTSTFLPASDYAYSLPSP
jgi:hypothetical protein